MGEGAAGAEAESQRQLWKEQGGGGAGRERAKTPGCREKAKSCSTTMLPPWLLANVLHVGSPRGVSVRHGQHALACPEAKMEGTRLTRHGLL